MTPAKEALNVAAQSRFPISYNGDGWLYWVALFGLIVMCLLMLQTALAIGNQIWDDRKRPMGATFAHRMTFFLVCITEIVRNAPEVAYRVAWGEVTPATLQLILTVKESLNILAAATLFCWFLIHHYFEPLWTLKLDSPSNRVWGGNTRFIKHAVTVAFLAAILAGSITFYKAFV